MRDADRATGRARPAAPSTSCPRPSGLHVVARTHGTGGRRTLLLGHHDTVYADRHRRGAAAAHRGRARARARRRRHEGRRAGRAGGARAARGERRATRPSSCTACPTRRAATSRRSRSRRCTARTPRSASSAGAPSGAIVTSRKAGCWVTITAHGVPAHAGTSPDEGRSALRALARELLRIEGELHHARPGMTAVATQLHAGDVKNTVPDEAWGVDRRARARRRRSRLRARPHPRGRAPRRRRLRVQRRPRLPAHAARARARRTRRCARSRRTGQPALEEAAGGVSDGSWTSHIGVPTVDGLGPVGGDDHTEREWIELASVGPRVDAIVALCEA